jgi:hypothetical protein
MRSISSLFAFRKSIFICHSSERDDADIAESIALRLRRQGFKVFLDKDNLRPGHAYDDHILREIIGASSAFLFLISPNSITPGRYTLTELEFAKQRWPDPSGAVLPVMIAKTDVRSVPPYLRAVTFSETQGDVVAKASAEVAKLIPRPTNLLPFSALLVAIVACMGAFLYFKPQDFVWTGSRSQQAQSRKGVDNEQPAKTSPALEPNPSFADQFPNNFNLIFSLELADDTPYLARDQVRISVPAKRWANYLGLHPEGYYSEQFDTPGKTSAFYALVTRKVETGYTGQPRVTSFCLRRSDHPPDKAKQGTAVMQCKEGDQPCGAFGADDEGLLTLSSACGRINGPEKSGSISGVSPFANLVFGTAAAASQERVWSIPSLDSLLARKSANVLRDGFTIFTIQSAQKLDARADAVSLDLAVNDTPVLVEGLPAALQPYDFDPEQPVKLKFGLQNLDFDGRYAGCDTITARLQFYKGGDAVGAPLSLDLRYAALRNVEASAIQTEKGIFTWSASYEVSNPQNKRTDWRVFVRTAPRTELAELQLARQQINDLGLVHSTDGHDYPVHAILRPPLHRHWGLALGLLQPSGQIRFTFTNDEARELKKFAKQKWRESGAVRRLFDPDPDLYQEPIDVDRRYSCGT